MNSRGITLLIGAVCLVVFCNTVAVAQQSPYSGQHRRDIKALSKDKIDAYYRGEGMGLGLAVELNHYPGPKHVLELADELELSHMQMARAQKIYDDMHKRAMYLGQRIVTEEGRLDSMISDGNITVEQMEAQVMKIAELQGKLRLTHMKAHLEMREELTEKQIRKYDEERGYGKE